MEDVLVLHFRKRLLSRRQTLLTPGLVVQDPLVVAASESVCNQVFLCRLLDLVELGQEAQIIVLDVVPRILSYL